MDKERCHNCEKKSSPDDPNGNWTSLHKRNGVSMLGCECGYGLYPGTAFSLVVHPDDVKDQIEQLKKAGVDPYEKKPAKKKKKISTKKN